MKKRKVYGIGHSNISFKNFHKILSHYKINCIIDVRSHPYTKYTPHFNKENLRKELERQRIRYLHFKDEFGARPEEKEFYVNRQVCFKKMTERSVFKEGVQRLNIGLKKGFSIVLMCSCSNPLSCHCFFMVCKYLVEQENYFVQYIFPFNKERYESLENKKEVKIEENGKTIDYTSEAFENLYHFAFEKWEKTNKKKYPRQEEDLLGNKEETENQYDLRLKNEYFKDMNKKIGYKGQ